jgi:hypothetical protein
MDLSFIFLFGLFVGKLEFFKLISRSDENEEGCFFYKD